VLVGPSNDDGGFQASWYPQVAANAAASSAWHFRYILSRTAHMTAQMITVQTNVVTPIEKVWNAYTTPEDIKQWNAASEDWHTPSATVDLREGGAFSSRMEAKDGSRGFGFAGTYTTIESHKLIEYDFGDRHAKVEFAPGQDGVHVGVTFEAETEVPIEQQRAGWQSILDNFKRHVEAA
jgi:uncharacterized protein YndB with AHSA1/START domain